MEEKCKLRGCNNPKKIRGLCKQHYSRLWYEGVLPKKKPRIVICKVDGCDQKSTNKGYCPKHTYHIKRYGYIPKRNMHSPNIFEIEEDICKIHIFDRQSNPKCIAIIDAEDYEKVKDYKWTIGGGYVWNRLVGKLHHVVMKSSELHDHKDRNPLNNRKENLRPCTVQQNSMNKFLPFGVSKYKGVHRCNGKWRAQIRINGKNKHLGYYTSETEAAKKYNRWVYAIHGEFAYLNQFPEETN